jgi:hypothetical protein
VIDAMCVMSQAEVKKEVVVKYLSSTLAAVSTLVLSYASASADAVPNLIGKWMGTSHSIMVGAVDSLPSGGGTWEKPHMFESPLEIEITNQEGRRFWGHHIVGGKKQGSFIAVLSTKGDKIIAVDSDGTISGWITGPDTVEVCYSHVAGDSTPEPSNSVVGCTEITRQK